MFHELRIAARSLARRPVWAATIAATLAIGLGGAATLFVVVDLVFLQPLPYEDSSRLALSWSTVDRDTVERRSYSWLDYLDLLAHAKRNEAGPIEGLAAFDNGNFILDAAAGEGDSLTRVDGAVVSPEYFPLLGVTPPTDTEVAAQLARAVHETLLEDISLGQGLRATDFPVRRPIGVERGRASFWSDALGRSRLILHSERNHPYVEHLLHRNEVL